MTAPAEAPAEVAAPPDERVLHFGLFPIAFCGFIGTTRVSFTETAGHDRCYECLRIMAGLREQGFRFTCR
jgi:hypothetical protein